MNTEKLERDLLDKCVKLEGLEPAQQKKLIEDTLSHLRSEWDIDVAQIDTPELKILSSAVLTQATSKLNAELQDLLLQKNV
jgi:hypothetical protein